MTVSSASRITPHDPAGRDRTEASTCAVATRYVCTVSATYSADRCTQPMLSGNGSVFRSQGVDEKHGAD